MKYSFFLFSLLFHIISGGIHTYSQVLYDTQSIMKITYERNDRIKAAFYKLESAKSNFSLFESEYTQFNPIVLDTRFNTNSDKIKESEASVGMEKEFFDGSSIGVYTGNNTGWGGTDDNRVTQYIETSVRFPLFSSNVKLQRLIKRTFEENSLYSAHLDYVDAVRENILNALEMYYDFLPRYKIYQMYQDRKKEILKLTQNDSISGRTEDVRQLLAEANSLQTEISNYEIGAISLKTNLKRWMNIDALGFEEIMPITLDFNQPGYWGEYYIITEVDSILQKALRNDTEFKVLKLIKTNAEEKKKLALKGKWDIFLSAGSRYNLYDIEGGIKSSSYWLATGGLQVRRFDQKTLDFTVKKAISDISSIEATIDDRIKEITIEINLRKETLIKKKEQLIATRISLDAWKQNYNIKLKAFISGTETIENLQLAFRSMVTTEVSMLNQENNYLDSIRDLDYVCGVYFEFLNIKIDA